MIIKYLKKELVNYEKLVYDCSGETWFLIFSKQSLHYPMKKYSCDFGIFMPKHLAGQWLLNSYVCTTKKPENLDFQDFPASVTGDERIELCIFIPLKWGKALIYKAFRLLET